MPSTHERAAVTSGRTGERELLGLRLSGGRQVAPAQSGFELLENILETRNTVIGTTVGMTGRAPHAYAQ